MTDRELLELAAKALGLTVTGSYGREDQGGGWLIVYPRQENVGWNPLIENDDAFRLAVDLEIVPRAGEVKCTAEWWVRPQMVELGSVVELTGDDPLAATRRAIVRAAAEIGLALPKN